jgi:hypothetical protein
MNTCGRWVRVTTPTTHVGPGVLPGFSLWAVAGTCNSTSAELSVRHLPRLERHPFRRTGRGGRLPPLLVSHEQR